jgi:hypothetical protein
MNNVPLWFRLLLLGLLPCIATVLYLRGQSYDPALIDFKAAGPDAPVLDPTRQSVANPAEDRTPPVRSFGEIKGFQQKGQERRYTRDNLYEHVDGHAEYFIDMGFTGLAVTEYSAAGSKAAQAEFQVEVFDMGKGLHAFGVLSDESGENLQDASVGSMGFKTSGGLNFIKGRYYVKISSANSGSQVLAFAKALSETLPAEKDSLNVFSLFPDLGRVVKSRFVKEGYRGLDFLHNVVEREYAVEDRKIIVALISDTGRATKALQASLFDYFRKSGLKTEKISSGKESYKILDKYEGTWFLIPTGQALFAVFGTDDEDIVKKFLGPPTK